MKKIITLILETLLLVFLSLLILSDDNYFKHNHKKYNPLEG